MEFQPDKTAEEDQDYAPQYPTAPCIRPGEITQTRIPNYFKQASDDVEN
jgi:hypothetical protein